MNKYHGVSFLCFIFGAIFFLLGINAGDVEVGFFLIFPFLIGSGPYAVFVFFFVFLTIVLFMFGLATRKSDDTSFDENAYETHHKKSIKGGGVILIGPIPIVFGSSQKIAILMILLSIILIIALSFFF